MYGMTLCTSLEHCCLLVAGYFCRPNLKTQNPKNSQILYHPPKNPKRPCACRRRGEPAGAGGRAGGVADGAARAARRAARAPAVQRARRPARLHVPAALAAHRHPGPQRLAGHAGARLCPLGLLVYSQTRPGVARSHPPRPLFKMRVCGQPSQQTTRAVCTLTGCAKR